MIYGWIYDKLGWVGIVGVTLLSGFVFYAIVVQISYYYYFVRHRDRFVPDYRESPDEMRQARLWSIRNMVGNTLLVLPVQLLIVSGYSRLYLDVGEYGWPYLVLSSVGALVFAETAIYWLHRLLHVRPFYGWLHAVHHRFREPTSMTSYAFNPVDSFIQSLPYHVYVFIVPTNVWVYLSLWTFSAFWTIMIHDRVRWSPDWLSSILNHTGCHTAHHWFYRHNYGNYFTFWDKFCGTYFNPDGLPEQFFAVKSSAAAREPIPMPSASAIVD